MDQLLENALEMTSLGEIRVNVTLDMGEERSEADVGFIGNPGMTQRNRSMKKADRSDWTQSTIM